MPTYDYHEYLENLPSVYFLKVNLFIKNVLYLSCLYIHLHFATNNTFTHFNNGVHKKQRGAYMVYALYRESV